MTDFNPWALIETCDQAIHTVNVEADVTKLTQEISEGIDNGFDINATDQYGGTMLIDACDRGVEEIALMLLTKEGVDIHFKEGTFDRTALHYAASSGLLSVVEKLLGMGAAPDEAGNKGFTPLLLAANGAHKKHIIFDSNAPQKEAADKEYEAFNTIIKLLIGKGADLEKKIIKTGQTAIFYAATYSDLEIANTLIAAGADVKCKDSQGLTALHFACRNANNVDGLKTVEALLNAGANPNEQDDFGFTPLMEAVLSNIPAAVKLLIENGADKNIQVTKGFNPYTNNESALDMAKDKNLTEILTLFA